MTQVVESIPEEHTVLGFKPENNPIAGSANAPLNKEVPAEASTLLEDIGEGVVGFKPKTDLLAEPINDQLKKHQIIVDWDKHELIKELHTWVERFTLEFKLKINGPAIKIDRLTRRCYGHYRPGRNGFGLCNEVAINERHIGIREYWQTLGTLLHELLHAEQSQSGKPGKNNYHNKAFRKKAESLGLIVDQWGRTQYSPKPSLFLDILAKYGVVVATDIPIPIVLAPKPGNSKLKLWICECKPKPVHVRVAIKDFKAKCLECGKNFRQGN